MEKHGCSEHVWSGFHGYPCSRSGKLNEDGKWWCKQHAPSAKAARSAKTSAKWEAERRANDAIVERCKRIAKELGVEVRPYYNGCLSSSHAIVPLEWLEHLVDMKLERNA